MAGDPAGKRRRATYADLEAVPPYMVAEIIEGELFTSPRPAVPHARAASRLTMKLGGPFDLGEGGPGGWVILDEPELHFGEDVLVPDLAAWRRERMPQVPATAAIKLAPNWVCEVLSPSTTAIDRDAKMRIYAREQVEHVWLVDPTARTLEIFRLDVQRWVPVTVHTGDVAVHAEPFDAIALDLSSLWAT